MPVDDLHAPLGFGRAAPLTRVLPWRALGIAALCLLAGSGYAIMRLTGDGQAGDAAVLVKLETAPPVRVQRPPAGSADTTATISAPKDTATASAADVERDSGVKVVRPAGADTPGALIISVPQALSTRLALAPDARLVEKTRHGLLPKIGVGGLRPAEIYARPVTLPAGLRSDAPRIAILVGGLGLNRATTQAAIASLPGAVSVAFAPYGGDLERDAAEARNAGHEILLQVPMEPYDGDGAPEPHTLLATASGVENVERLRWAMGRFPGYVGIANFLGAKFTASDAALAPVLREIAARGLLYADDGSSARSLVASLAPSYALAATKADIVIDAAPRANAIDAALVKLEALAREKGLAVATASALPSSIDRIAAFARGLEARGIALVPLSAAADGIHAAPIVKRSP